MKTWALWLTLVLWSAVSLAQTVFVGPSAQLGPVSQSTNQGTNFSFVTATSLAQCPTTGTSCPIATPSTVAGAILVASLINIGGAGSVVKFSAGSGGGGAWALCSSFTGAPTCSVYDSTDNISLDLIVNYTGTGGATSITFTLSQACTLCFVEVDEFTRNSGTTSVDQVATPTYQANCTTCNLLAFNSLTGSSDLLVQSVFANESPNTYAEVGPYVLTSGVGIYALSSVFSGTPTYQQQPSGAMLVSGIAFK